MTELTEKYLRNYLEKKSLVMAALQEVNDSRPKSGELLDVPTAKLQMVRHQTAVAMWSELNRTAEASLSYYMAHLRSER